LDAALKRRSSTTVKNNVENNVKSSGQECPLHINFAYIHKVL
jgi:hypothetical protein